MTMTRVVCQAFVAPFIRQHEQYACVDRKDARDLLGDAQFALLLKDPIRNLGPVPDTFYPWNVVDHLYMKENPKQ